MPRYKILYLTSKNLLNVAFAPVFMKACHFNHFDLWWPCRLRRPTTSRNPGRNGHLASQSTSIHQPRQSQRSLQLLHRRYHCHCRLQSLLSHNPRR
jgi:hypothetical protein